MMSSTIPSAKYSCSGSPLMFWNGRTAIDGMSGAPRSGAGAAIGLAPVRACAPSSATVDADRPGDVLQLLLALVDKADIDPAFDVLLHARRHADAARLGEALEARRDVHAVAENIVVLDDDVADMDADAEVDALGLGHARHCARPCRAGRRRRSATASTTLANSTSRPSPVVLTSRPLCSASWDRSGRRDGPSVPRACLPRRRPPAGHSRRHRPPRRPKASCPDACLPRISPRIGGLTAYMYPRNVRGVACVTEVSPASGCAHDEGHQQRQRGDRRRPHPLRSAAASARMRIHRMAALRTENRMPYQTSPKTSGRTRISAATTT